MDMTRDPRDTVFCAVFFVGADAQDRRMGRTATGAVDHNTFDEVLYMFVFPCIIVNSRRLPKTLSDQFLVRVCACPLCV